MAKDIIPPLAVNTNVHILGRKPPIKDTLGKDIHWETPLDMLKELVNDLEHGRIAMPASVYVAMRVHHPDDNTKSAYPHYMFSDGDILTMAGVLAKHQRNLLG